MYLDEKEEKGKEGGEDGQEKEDKRGGKRGGKGGEGRRVASKGRGEGEKGKEWVWEGWWLGFLYQKLNCAPAPRYLVMSTAALSTRMVNHTRLSTTALRPQCRGAGGQAGEIEGKMREKLSLTGEGSRALGLEGTLRMHPTRF